MLWVRLKLPFRLNHVNIYLLADGDGWAMIDSGFGNEESIAAWTALFEGPLQACEDHAADRDPFASRSRRPRRLDRRALQLSAATCRRSNICSRSITRTAAPKSAATRSGCSSAVTAWTRT